MTTVARAPHGLLVCWSMYVLMCSGACARSPAMGSRDVRFGDTSQGKIVRQDALQDGLQRFSGQLIDDISQAAAPLANDPALRRAVIVRTLRYSAAIMDIATGPLPEVNTLDMIVLLTLCRSAYERHFLYEFGEHAEGLLFALRRGEANAWQLSAVLLDDEKRARLRELIASWLDAHPDQYVVEGVRFTDFAVRAGEVSAEQSGNARGLLGNVRSATLTAERALLLSERAVFLAHRMPFLLRLQARLGANEILSDSMQQLDSAKELMHETRELGPLLSQLQQLITSAEQTSQETRKLLEAMQPLLHYASQTSEATESEEPGLQDALTAANRLTDQTLALVTQARVLADKLPSDPERALQRATQSAGQLASQGFYYLVALGALWSLLFWGFYYLARRLLARGAR